MSSACSSYYESARKNFIDTPFESKRLELNYSIPLHEWGKWCISKEVDRRKHYRVPAFVRIEDLETRGAFSLNLSSKKTGRVMQVCFSRDSLTHFEVDAIVNAANESLLGGGGVDDAVHKAAGPTLVKECATIDGGCEVGDAKLTKGYDLPAKYVIHTVGPLLKKDETPDHALLRKSYQSCLDLCDQNGFTSLAFPCISCGFYAFPFGESAKVVLAVLSDHLESTDSKIKTIILSLPKDKEWMQYIEVFSSF
jgi:O-acetyl-ADP-ribose deacetylase (regulator of RNase III)